MTEGNPCPCGSGRAYRACCRAYHRAEARPEEPELLVRARFSAFARKEDGFLFRTLHTAHPDRGGSEAAARAAIRRSAARYRYMGLRIYEAAPPDESGLARVLFLARVFERGNRVSFVELSDFSREEGEWRYLSGRMLGAEALGGNPPELTIPAFLALLARRGG